MQTADRLKFQLTKLKRKGLRWIFWIAFTTTSKRNKLDDNKIPFLKFIFAVLACCRRTNIIMLHLMSSSSIKIIRFLLIEWESVNWKSFIFIIFSVESYTTIISLHSYCNKFVSFQYFSHVYFTFFSTLHGFEVVSTCLVTLKEWKHIGHMLCYQ